MTVLINGFLTNRFLVGHHSLFELSSCPPGKLKHCALNFMDACTAWILTIPNGIQMELVAYVPVWAGGTSFGGLGEVFTITCAQLTLSWCIFDSVISNLGEISLKQRS